MEKIYHYVDSSRFLVICAVFFLFGAIPAYASDIQYYYFEPELLPWSFMKPDEYQPAVKYDVNSDGAVNVTDTVFIVSELIE